MTRQQSNRFSAYYRHLQTLLGVVSAAKAVADAICNGETSAALPYMVVWQAAAGATRMILRAQRPQLQSWTSDVCSEGTRCAIQLNPVYLFPTLAPLCLFQDHLHAAKNLVENFKEPVCLVPVELPQVSHPLPNGANILPFTGNTARSVPSIFTLSAD